MKIIGKNIILNGYKFFKPSEANELIFPFMEVALFCEGNIITPVMCLTYTTAEEDYDYNYEDELEYTGIITNTSYYPITNSPINNGEKIKFEVTSEIDISEEYNNISAQIEELESMRKSNSRTRNIFILQKKQNELIQEIPTIFFKDDRIISDPYDEHEAASIFEVLNREEY